MSLRKRLRIFTFRLRLYCFSRLLY